MQALKSMGVAGIPVEGILHIGANTGQERDDYLKSGATPCIYVEPIDAVFAQLKSHLADIAGHIPVQAVCSDVAGEKVTFHIASNGGLSSSMLDLGDHALHHPQITYVGSQEMTTTTVDDLIDGMALKVVPNLLIVDTQGADLKVLRGARKTLQFIDGVFVEVSESPLYDGGCTFDEVSSHLTSLGFRLRWTSMNAVGHGDAFYCRALQDGKDLPTYGGDLALKGQASQSSQSIYSNSDDAAGAINGRKTGGYSFHTDEEQEPWWQVDLGGVQSLHEIRVYNRLDAARQRARTLQVYISIDGQNWDLVHDQAGHAFGGVDGRPLRIMVEGGSGQFVRLKLAERTSLHLDAVEIY